jgi:hypothetical protein
MGVVVDFQGGRRQGLGHLAGWLFARQMDGLPLIGLRPPWARLTVPLRYNFLRCEAATRLECAASGL